MYEYRPWQIFNKKACRLADGNIKTKVLILTLAGSIRIYCHYWLPTVCGFYYTAILIHLCHRVKLFMSKFIL